MPSASQINPVMGLPALYLETTAPLTANCTTSGTFAASQMPSITPSTLQAAGGVWHRPS